MTEVFTKDRNRVELFEPPGVVTMVDDDGETPPGWGSMDDAVDFCAAFVESQRSCANCHRFLDYPLTHHGGWCNRLTIGVPTSPDFYCKAWEAQT